MAEVNLRDPQYSLLNQIGGGLNSLGQYLSADSEAARQYQDQRASALSQALSRPVPGGQMYLAYQQEMMPPDQLGQNAHPSAAIIPAAQVVANATADSLAPTAPTPQEMELSRYFQSLFPKAEGVTAAPATLPTGMATVMQPSSQAGTASPFSGSMTPQPARSAPLSVAANGTTNFWKQNQNPTRTWNSINNVPEYSLGGQLLLASQLGMSPQQLMSGLDAIQARGITESPYWQTQYNQALQETGDPNAALAHANLASTEAGQNTAGVFARSLATPTDQASNISADRAYGRTVLNPSAGEAYQNVLSTANTPVGATPAGNVLARTPDGNVTTLPIGPYSAANASYVNSGAQAFQNALAREMAYTPGTGVGTRGATVDPYTRQLRQQELELKVQAAQQRLDNAGKKDPRIAQAQSILRSLPKDDPRREQYLEFLNQVGTDAGIVAPNAGAPALR
jgi:hypothetical protein